jgi:hypothetical protein
MQIKDTTKNEEIKPVDPTLEDLPVVEEQSEVTKGAGAPNGRLYLGTDQGVFVG